MDRIDTLKLIIATGHLGHDEPVKIEVRGAELELHRISGGTQAEETYEGESFLGCVASEAKLLPPAQGHWELRDLQIIVRTIKGRTWKQKLGRQTLLGGTGCSFTLLPEAPEIMDV